MKSIQYHLLRIMAGLTAAALLMTACGKKADPSSTSGSAADSPAAPVQISSAAPADPGEPVQGGEITVAVTQEPDSLDPYLAAAAGTKEIIYNLFEGLMKLNPDGTFSPALAAEYQVSDDAKIYTFVLRDGVRFHNGQTMTAEDVVWSLSRAAGLLPADGSEPASAEATGRERKPLIQELGVINRLEADADQRTVTVSLSQPDADFLSYMTVAIIPAGYTDQAHQPVGTGPFTFTEYQTQQHVVLSRYADYWGERPAYVDKVTFRIVPSADAAMVDLQAGRIDIFPYLTMDKAELVKDQYDFVDASSNMVQLWALNNQRPPFDNPDVRRALNLAVDKQMLIDVVTFGQGTILESGMAPSMGAFYNGELNPMHRSDLEQAAELLKKAGYDNNLSIDITVPGNYQIHVQTAEVIAAQLTAVGVTANIRSVDWGTWLSDVYQGRDYDSTVIALTFDYCAPSTVMGRYVSDAGNNFINFNAPDYDALYEKAAAEVNVEKRAGLYRELQAILYNESGSVYLQNPGVQTAVSKRLGGYTTYPMYVQDMYNVYFKKQ